MATFYIDYENVHYGGTAGIDQLGNDEYVYLFYSQSANSMNMETVKNFLCSRCGIEFIEADAGTSNALDFQLITFLFTCIGQDDYHYIISKDHGFDAAVKMGKRLGIEHIWRFVSIAEAFRHYEREIQKNAEANAINIDSINGSESNEYVSEIAVEESSHMNEKAKSVIKEKIKQVVQKESGFTIPKEEIEVSIEGVCVCHNKMSLYHYLRSKLGDKRGRAVYGAISDSFLNWQMDLVS